MNGRKNVTGGMHVLEIPEALTIARQLNAAVGRKEIARVIADFTPHRFAWYHGDPVHYHHLLVNRTICDTRSWGGLIEIQAHDVLILLGDDIGIRYHDPGTSAPKKHQLLVEFTDGSGLSATVGMYGGLWCFKDGDFTNPYYEAAKEKPSPLSEQFDAVYFLNLFQLPNVSRLSAKAFLATEQRIPGLVMVCCRIFCSMQAYIRKKMGTLTDGDQHALFESIKITLEAMTELGGRDTEKDLFGQVGSYETKLSAKTKGKPCPQCGTLIRKETYLGGSVYYCQAVRFIKIRR